MKSACSRIANPNIYFFFLVRFSCLLVRTCWKTHHQPITNHPRIGRRKRLWRRQSAGVGRALPPKNCWVLQGKYPLKKTRVLSTQWTAKWSIKYVLIQSVLTLFARASQRAYITWIMYIYIYNFTRVWSRTLVLSGVKSCKIVTDMTCLTW